jgi:peptidoglycan/xylan/chitin deacetylase (PgdA/CDA1 family)
MSVAWWLRRTGLLRALESIRRQPRLLVLNYHRIGEIAGNQLDDATFSATADRLREQVRYLKRWFAVPSVDEVLDSLDRGSFSNPTVLITFDDGYRDNYELAFPILRELGVPACFFVVTGLLDAPTLPWWDRVAYTIKMMDGLTFEISYPEHLTIDLREVSRASATWRVLRACKEARSFDEPRFADELAMRTGVSVDARSLARRLFMSWESVREMARGGMTIGSHTVTHSVLASLSESAQRRELRDSRDRIAEAVGLPPGMLAYPVGGPRSFTRVTRQLAREAGYRAAFSYGGVTNAPWPLDPLSIPRTAVEYSHTRAQFRLRSTLATIQVPLLFQHAAARLQARSGTKRSSLPGYT